MANGIFGPTPEQVQAATMNERLQQLSTLGSLPLGTLGGGIAGVLGGEALSSLGGGGGGEMDRALLLQDAQQEVLGSGLRPGQEGFTKFTVGALLKRGLLQEAQQAQLQGLELEKAQAQTSESRESLRRETGQATIAEQQARFAGQRSRGLAEQATAGARIAELKLGNLPDQLAADLQATKARRLQALASASSASASAARTRQAMQIDRASFASSIEKDIAKLQREDMDDAVKLLDRWTKATDRHVLAGEAWDRFQALAAQQTSVSDTGLLVAYTKMLDPNSAANQGEVATQTAALGGAFAGFLKQLRSQGFENVVLTAPQRQQLFQAAQALAASNSEAFGSMNRTYSALAERLGVDPRNVVLRQPQAIGAPQAQGQQRRVFNPQTGQLE